MNLSGAGIWAIPHLARESASTLTKLDISSNGLGPHGATALAQPMANLTP